MQEIKQWCISVVAVCLCGFLLRGVMPSGKITESAIVVLRLLILCVLLFPIFKINIDELKVSDLFENQIEDNTVIYDVESIIVNQTEAALRQELESRIEQSYNGYYEIQIDADILSDNSIHIKRVLIILHEEIKNKDEVLQSVIDFCPLCEIVFSEVVNDTDE